MISCKNEKKREMSKKPKFEQKAIERQIDSLTREMDSVINELRVYKTRFKSIEYISTGKFRNIENGENEVYGENYRVEIYLSEIYKTIYISHIEYYGEGMQRISSRKQLDFEKFTGILSEQTNKLEFRKWNNYKQFELRLGNQIYVVKIVKPDTFVISKL
jgi:hypothetical protein